MHKLVDGFQEIDGQMEDTSDEEMRMGFGTVQDSYELAKAKRSTGTVVSSPFPENIRSLKLTSQPLSALLPPL